MTEKIITIIQVLSVTVIIFLLVGASFYNEYSRQTTEREAPDNIIMVNGEFIKTGY